MLCGDYIGPGAAGEIRNWSLCVSVLRPPGFHCQTSGATLRSTDRVVSPRTWSGVTSPRFSGKCQGDLITTRSDYFGTLQYERSSESTLAALVSFGFTPPREARRSQNEMISVFSRTRRRARFDVSRGIPRIASFQHSPFRTQLFPQSPSQRHFSLLLQSLTDLHASVQ